MMESKYPQIPDESIDNRLSSKYIDLLSERLGGSVIACSDEWFAESHNLIKPGRGVYKEGHFVSTGQWMDGWETRRSFGRKEHESKAEHLDWCILRLGIPGVIGGFDIDTNHFRGNAPQYASVEATNVKNDVDTSTKWTTILPKSPLRSDRQNLFDCDNSHRWTHVRLKIYPDGGVARFRVYGTASVNPDHYVDGELVELSSVFNGGLGISASDSFFSSPSNLIMPGRGTNMGDGWETKRRRDAFNDWAIIKFGITGSILKVIVDTNHFKGNYPDCMSLEAVFLKPEQELSAETEWQTVISKRPIFAHRQHVFIKEIETSPVHEFSHVRVNIFPDGGLSRVKIIGKPNWKSMS
jgi:allantoicase